MKFQLFYAFKAHGSQTRPIVITVSTRVVRPSPLFHIKRKKQIFSAGRAVGRAKGIIDDSTPVLLIHEADPQSRPVVIIVFAYVVRSYVRQYVRPSVPTGETVGLAEWIIDYTCLVVFIFLNSY